MALPEPPPIICMRSFIDASQSQFRGRVSCDSDNDQRRLAGIHIGRTITAMRSDGVIAPQTSATEIHRELQERLDQFF